MKRGRLHTLKTSGVVRSLRVKPKDRDRQHRELNPYFQRIVTEGTGKRFDISHNQHWLRHARPILEAFFHARHFLEMICKYAEELDEPDRGDALPFRREVAGLKD